MLYHLTTIDMKFGAGPDIAKAATAWSRAADARSTLLGLFATDVGTLNQVYILSAVADAKDLAAERRRAEVSANPFNAGEWMLGMSMEGFAPFPNFAPPTPGAHGGVYEFRAYRIKTGGLAPTLALWDEWLPGRQPLSPCLMAMYALDGPSRFTHIWPYADAAHRSRTRADAVSKGVWPPKGGPAWLFDMRSTLTVPLAGSPLA